MCIPKCLTGSWAPKVLVSRHQGGKARRASLCSSALHNEGDFHGTRQLRPLPFRIPSLPIKVTHTKFLYLRMHDHYPFQLLLARSACHPLQGERFTVRHRLEDIANALRCTAARCSLRWDSERWQREHGQAVCLTSCRLCRGELRRGPTNTIRHPRGHGPLDIPCDQVQQSASPLRHPDVLQTTLIGSHATLEELPGTTEEDGTDGYHPQPF